MPTVACPDSGHEQAATVDDIAGGHVFTCADCGSRFRPKQRVPALSPEKRRAGEEAQQENGRHGAIAGNSPDQPSRRWYESPFTAFFFAVAVLLTVNLISFAALQIFDAVKDRIEEQRRQENLKNMIKRMNPVPKQ